VNTRSLRISYGTSRGRETYGWTIVTLRDETTGKRYRTIGGGYDMIGTVFGSWLQDVAQAELVTLQDRAYGEYVATDGVTAYSTNRSAGALYGMATHYTRNMTSVKITLDGACGIESMRRIATAAGIDVKGIVNGRGHTVGYLVTGEML
jgi:hypothetical protein